MKNTFLKINLFHGLKLNNLYIVQSKRMLFLSINNIKIIPYKLSLNLFFILQP